MATARLNYYIALIHKDSKSDYGVQFPDFPGCITAEKSYEKTMEMAVEALSHHVDLMREFGDPIPTPRSLKEIQKSGKFKEELEDAMITLIPLLPVSSDPITISASIDRALLAKIDAYANRTGRTRSGLFAEGAKMIMAAHPAPKQEKPASRR